MASQYKVYPAWDTPLASLVSFAPQCQSPGIKATRRDVSQNGAVIDQGLYVELMWPVLSQKAFNAVMVTLGFASGPTPTFNGALMLPVTVYCRDATYTYNRYNGHAIAPVASWQDFRVRNLTVIVRDLVPSA
jgi:hypothetical protein